MKDKRVLVRGGGELATGVIYKLHKSGYHVLILEQEQPTAIRRNVSFCEAAYDGISTVEGVVCRKINHVNSCEVVWSVGEVPLLVDDTAGVTEVFRPDVVIDAAPVSDEWKTTKDMAPLTIGLGPGYVAGIDVDYVIETMRGHHLGRIISAGCATPDHGIPGLVAGYGRERVLHAKENGRILAMAKIGDVVEKGQVIAMIGEVPVCATLPGVLRGMIRDGYQVAEGQKIAEIDPRIDQRQNCHTISDKARCIAGGVLELVVQYDN